MYVCYDRARLTRFVEAQDDAPKPRESGGATIYSIDDGALALHGEYLIAGAAPLVEQALRAKAGKGVMSGRHAGALKTASSSASGFAFIASSAHLQRWLSRNAGDSPELAKVQHASFGFDLSRGLGFDVRATFSDAAAASAVVKQVETALSEIRGDAEMRELGFAELAGKVSANARGTAVTINFALSAEETNAVLALVKEIFIE
jgi:hypothetical protein